MYSNESDEECYEQLDDSMSPPTNFANYSRPISHASHAHSDQRKSRGHASSIIPPDIDRRPPCPIPKSSTRISPGQLSYDSITVSPMTPDYGMSSSASPPRNGYSIPINGYQKDDKPPVPPINPHRKPPSRSVSESSDQLSVTPPRSLTNTMPRLNNGTLTRHNTVGYRHTRSSSESGDISPQPLPTTMRQSDSNSSRPSSGHIRNSRPMALRIFSEKHRGDLPLQVVVTKGYYGPDDRTSISDGDMFNIHFFKQAKIVKVQDSSRYEYTIPLNSSLEFGLLYQLPSGFKQVDLKYHFKTVGDIMQLKVLPKVLLVTRSYRGSGAESSVEQNDLLIVQEIVKKRGIKSSKVLKCVVAGTSVKKSLSEDCAGHFSVKPSDTKLFLPEIVEHVSLPVKANVYANANGRVDLPQHIMQDDIEVIRVEIEESIVATAIHDDDNGDKPITPYQNTVSTPLVDIPQDLDIEVAIMGLGDGETNQLYAKTRSLCEKYNPGDAAYLNLPSSITANTQSTLFRTIRQDHNRQVGVEIMRPLNAFRSPSGDSSSHRLSNGSDSSRRQLCTPSECANAEEVNCRLESLEKQSIDINDRLNKFEILIQNSSHGADQKQKLSQLQEDVSKARKENEELRRIVSDLPDQFTQLNATVDTLKRTIDLLQSELTRNPRKVSKLNGVVNGTTTTNKSDEVSNSDFEAQNREFLQRLSHVQVVNLLTAMSLGQYVEAFKSEQIDGEILSELNEEDLQQELGVASKIHRIKLMKIIMGRHSAISIINGDDPYYVHLAQSK